MILVTFMKNALSLYYFCDFGENHYFVDIIRFVAIIIKTYMARLFLSPESHLTVYVMSIT